MAKQHDPDCEYHRSATCTTPVECEHGRDVCPTCDPCTCKPPMPETTKELVAWLQDVEGAPGFTPEWTEKIRAAAARLEELEGVPRPRPFDGGEPLPVLGDGVLWCLNEILWTHDDAGAVSEFVPDWPAPEWTNSGWAIRYGEGETLLIDCYSTREAAEAAQARGRG